MSTERQQLLDLILEVSFERKKVVLSSGKESDFYLDLRQTLRACAFTFGSLIAECTSLT